MITYKKSFKNNERRANRYKKLYNAMYKLANQYKTHLDSGLITFSEYASLIGSIALKEDKISKIINKYYWN